MSGCREYEEIIRPIEPKMMRSVWRIVQDPERAKDAFQDALEKVWKKWSRIRKHPNPQALILRICTNTAMDHLRRGRREKRHEELELKGELVADPAPTAAAQLESQEIQTEVMTALSQLPRNQSEAMVMRFVQDLPYSAIAEAIGCAEATVRTHIARGRASLRQMIAPLVPNSQERSQRNE